MSAPINAEAPVPTGQVAPEEYVFSSFRVWSRTTHSTASFARASSSKESLKDVRGADPEFLALLADTQNTCLEELGYSSTLLVEFQELKKECAALQRQRGELHNQCNLLRADNTKLYADNRSLATFIQQQDQRMKLLQDPNDQQKRTITELHESVRRATNERDELAGRLHAAYVFTLSFGRSCYRGVSCFSLNEIVVLRQELSRFLPNAIMVSPRERMPSGGVPIPPPSQRVPSQPPIHPSMLVPHGAIPYFQRHSVFDSLFEPAPINMHYQHLAAKVSGIFNSTMMLNINLSSAATNTTWCPTLPTVSPTSRVYSYGRARQ